MVGSYQRGFARWGLVLFSLLTIWLWWGHVGAVWAGSRSFTVSTTVDGVDVNPGDGVCATVAGECSLRGAIQETNALTGKDIIYVPAGLYVLTIEGRGED
ncbi:MAG TPA: CSLREA domain-containing protein, partial [Anaerolineae bacterium]|nr:CSLREA domain-containing protein [Anaerolineae bacterium]